MYEKELTRIINASKNNSLSFFVGAGVSRVSGAPMWNELTNAICTKLGIKLQEDYSYEECLKIPQMYYSSLEKNHKNEYFKTVEDAINNKELLPNAVHREMLALDPVSFITTNYDELLEESAGKYCQTYKSIACDKDVPSISGDRYILKMHGDFKHKNFVLKEEDYLNYSEKFKLIETLLKSIFATNTVVFIGYRLNDYNIKLILNWAKELLKSDFREPIFFYTDDEELSPLELKYHESKGVAVLEWGKIDKSKSQFPDRYLTFFDAIKKIDVFDYNGKNDNEAFKTLYYMLKPLDELKALRYTDIAKRLSQNNLIVEGNGSIRIWDNNVLFSRFIEIDKLQKNEKEALSKETYKMYKTIKSVLAKACIYWIYDNKSVHTINHDDIPFADPYCIMFDYKWMNNYVKKQYKTIDKKYTQAFYLYKLGRYSESLASFLEISRRAFDEKNYLLFYFAKANCYKLRTIVENSHSLFKQYDPSEIEDDLPIEKQVENLFNRLPFEFRKNYESLKDIHGQILLYKYAYEAFEAAHKVVEVIETNTIEYGITSSYRAINRVNDYVNFLLANGLVADVFTEYKTSVKRIMEAILHKYSVQDKQEILVNNILPNREEKIVLDEIDFNCLVECFKDKELVRLLKKNSISLLEFKDIKVIENAVKNLLDYFMVVKTSGVFNEYVHIQSKLKNALVLLRYINLSQEFVDYICTFIMTNEFRDILITDKVLFLDSQIYNRKMYSDKTIKSIENALLNYFDIHKKALDEGTELNVAPSTNVNISYCNLANYLKLDDKDYVSRGLSERVNKIIEDEQYQLFSASYYKHITKKQQKNLREAIEKRLEKQFDIRLLMLLLEYKPKINKTIKNQLLTFLRTEKENDDIESVQKGVRVYPAKRKYENIIQAGYWCFLNIIDTTGLEEFLGVADEFDFYYQYEKFDYEKFDVRWLFDMRDIGLRKMAENDEVSRNIRQCIIKSIRTNNYSKLDNDKLKEMLVKYFC